MIFINYSRNMLKVRCYNKNYKYFMRSSFTIYRSINTSIILKEKELSSGYKPRELEHGENFKAPGYFPESRGEKIYSVVLPPPNITGNLHLGHALNLTVQDVLARWHKLLGNNVMWVPGFDHAGIATQVTVEKQLLKQIGKTRHEIGKEEFINYIWNWKNDKGKLIKNQLLGMASLLNWQKEVFTLDPNMMEAANEAFIRLFEDGLIYRENALVNWCCHLQSALSDIEVQAKEITGPTYLNIPGYEKPVKFGVMTEFAYKLCDMDGEIIVATTRPETIHGDVAIAISPNDPRYSHLKNAKVLHPFHNKPLPIIYDEIVDPQFGTGALKVTPAHDLRDFALSKKHNLPVVQIIDEHGNMRENCGFVSNMKRYDARITVINELKKMNLFKQTKDHAMSIPTCSRTGDVIELLMKPQWFLDCKNMAKLAMQEVKDGRLEIEPKDFEQNWYHWLSNIRDWCISRQLWWGHRIPVYQCHDKNKPEHKIVVAAKDETQALEKAQIKLNISKENIAVIQDSDVLDTWFSSALFPFAVHGWPKKADDLKKYYPLNVMLTGHDILFFWVARMIMLGTKLLDELPFRKILLHGIICDLNGRKMSKSLGNTIEPEDIINGISLEDLQKRLDDSHKMGILSSEEVKKSLKTQKKMFPNGIPECGTDALRFTLCSKNIKTHFINFDVRDCLTNKLFGNKIWQATKYTKLLMNLCRENNKFENTALEKKELAVIDLWILSKLSNMISKVNTSLQNNDFHLATAALKQFLYAELCDVYIESTKPHIKTFSSKSVVSCYMLIISLNFALKQLSLFMPYLSQELLNALPEVRKVFDINMTTFFPTNEMEHYSNDLLEQNIEYILDIISTVRRIQKIHNISKKLDMKVVLQMKSSYEKYNFINSELELIKIMTRCANIEISEDIPSVKSVFDTVDDSCCVHIISNDLRIETSKGINKKYNKLLKEIAKLQATIGNERYKEGAPKHVQELHNNKLQSLLTELHQFECLQEIKTN